MKNSLKIFILIALVSIPAALYAQGDASAKHAINTKGAGSGDKVALASCPAVEQSVIVAAEERLKTRTKSNNTNERSGMPAQVSPNGVQPQDAQKTKTKSNNANDRIAASAVRVIQAGCSEPAAVDMGQAISFKWTHYNWIKKSFDGREYRLRIWQLQDGQTAADGMVEGNLRTFQKASATVDRFDMDSSDVNRLLRRPRDISNSFVWEVQALDGGKAVGEPQVGTFQLAPVKP